MLAGLLPCAAPLAAQGAVGEFQFPTYPIGPQTVALGGAGVALGRDAEGGLNPASLLNAPRVSIHHFQGYADYSGNLLAASVGLYSRLAVGFSLRHFGWKDVVQDDLGPGAGSLTAGNSEYALTVASAPTPFLQVGVTASRLLTDNLGVRIAATSWSAGLIVRHSERGRAGIALRHAGAPAVNSDRSMRYPLPTRLRVGVAQGMHLKGTPVLLAVDGEVPTPEMSNWSIQAGLEWSPAPALALRGGYESAVNQNTGRYETRWAAGLGLTLGRFEVGLTKRLGGPPGADELFVGVDVLRPRPDQRGRPVM